MSFYMNMALNEGEQAEAYLKRKQNEYQRAKDVDSKYNYGNSRNMRDGEEWSQRQYKDPSLQAGREIKEYRTKYPNAVPKSETRAEKLYDKKLDKMRDEMSNADRYAADALDNYWHKTNPNIDNTDCGKIYDATKRHYRRHIAKESGIFSECNFIEFAY